MFLSLIKCRMRNFERLRGEGSKTKLSFWATNMYRYTNNWVHPNPHLLQNLKSSISHCHKSIVYGFIYLSAFTIYHDGASYNPNKQFGNDCSECLKRCLTKKQETQLLACQQEKIIDVQLHGKSWRSTNNLNWHRHVQALSIYDIKLLKQSVGAVPSTLALVWWKLFHRRTVTTCHPKSFLDQKYTQIGFQIDNPWFAGGNG